MNIKEGLSKCQPHELSSSRVLVKEVLHLGIAHVVGDLKQMNPEHQLKRERLPAAAV